MIRVSLIEHLGKGVSRRIPLDECDPATIEIARRVAGKSMSLRELIALIRDCDAMYGRYSMIGDAP